MRITYDSEADAVYVYLSENAKHLETRQVDSDIYLDFDTSGRLSGVEVLGASKRLDLDHLLPGAELLVDTSLKWRELRQELVRRKHAGEPIETPVQHVKNWIQEVGEDFVVLISERSKSKTHRKVLRSEIEESDTEKYPGRRRLIYALRKAGGYSRGGE